ncbi:MAG: amidohydrolase [Candidatus Omnitrophota bacterium]
MKRTILTILIAFTCAVLGCVDSYAASQRQAVDTLISGGTVVTVNSDMAVIEDGAVAIKNGVMVAVGTRNVIEGKFKANITINAAGKIVMPGLVNTHTHAAMVLFRGYADDLPLLQWLKEYIWPAEAEFISRENVRIASRLAIAEMLRSGTTTFNDMYFFEDDVAQVAKEAGIRVMIGEGLLDYPTPNSKTPEAGLKYTEELLKKYSGDRLVTVAVAPHAPYTCSGELLKKAADLSKKYNSPLHIHLAETKDEVNDIVERYKMRPVAYLDSLGLLTDRTIAAHSIQVTDEELELLAARKTGVAHNPQSNMKLAEGVAPVPPMLVLKVKVGLGTDGAASNNDLNMFEEMRTAALLHKVYTWTPTVLDARSVLRIATIGGAEVLGLQDKIGSLEEGKEADIIIIDVDQPHLVPLYNIYSLLVYAANGADVDTVMVAGKVVMKGKKLLTIDEQKAIGDMRVLAEHIKENGVGP